MAICPQTGKIRFGNRYRAWRQMLYVQRWLGGAWNHYLCQGCDGWHIGHRRRKAA